MIMTENTVENPHIVIAKKKMTEADGLLAAAAIARETAETSIEKGTAEQWKQTAAKLTLLAQQLKQDAEASLQPAKQEATTQLVETEGKKQTIETQLATLNAEIVTKHEEEKAEMVKKHEAEMAAIKAEMAKKHAEEKAEWEKTTRPAKVYKTSLKRTGAKHTLVAMFPSLKLKEEYVAKAKEYDTFLRADSEAPGITIEEEEWVLCWHGNPRWK
jgi:hypothetical protein